MNKKADFQSQHEDPYEVIRKLRGLLNSQRTQLQEYQMVCDSLVFEKNAAVKQSNDLKRELNYLTQKLQQQRLGKSRTNSGPLDLFQTRVFSKQNRLNYATLSPQLVKSDISTSHIIYLNSTPQGQSKKATKSKEFIPSEIVFKNKEPTKHIYKSNTSAESSSQNLLDNVGENLIQDFIVISPDILELKRLKESQKEQRQLKIEEYYLFNYNTLYKNRKAQYLKEVAKRAFPLGAIAKRKRIQNYQQFKNDLEFDISNKMGEEYFVFNLKGDLADSQKSKKDICNCNPFQGLFAICLRVPDFIPIKQQKYNQKKEQQVWMVEKIYTILSYFPFFNIHLSILCKIHKILEPLWYKLQKEQILSKNLQRNLTEAQQNLQINRLISFLMSKKPEFGKICLHENYYFGTIPTLGFNSEYCIARFCCGIFFSSFAYEQMLLLLTAMFLQKTIILASKSQSAATLCALFLTTMIGPFKYNQHLILNCDKQKVDSILFEFPFILVASIKKDANFHNVLKMFIDNNCDRFKGFSGKDQTAPMMLVDIDSNTILYDPLMNKTFQQLIVSPSETLRQAYMQVNPANSKSFTFPKKMPVEVVSRPKNDYEKNQEERRKIQKEYQHKLDNNLSKWPTYTSNQDHFKVLSLLTEYIQSFGINPDYHYELIVSTRQNRELRKEKARSHLLAKHPLKHKLVNVLIESQLYADYLDDIQKEIEGQD